MQVFFDVMGCEKGLHSTLKGVYQYTLSSQSILHLIGHQEQIELELNQQNFSQEQRSKIRITHTPDVIQHNDSPTKALRMKSSSISKLFELTKQEQGIAVSFGNTGATVLLAVHYLGRDRTVSCPVIMARVQLANQSFFVADAGAKVAFESEDYLSVAHAVNHFLAKFEKKPNARLALLNIGEEAHKGGKLQKTAYQLLSNAEGINFCGNVEGYIPDLIDQCDAVITDGFTGNIFIKTIEGMIFKLNQLYNSNQAEVNFTKQDLGSLFFKEILSKLKTHLNGILLGVNQPVIIGHGIADEIDIYSTLKVAEKYILNAKSQAITI